MSLKFEGESLLRDHNDLFFELIMIPEERVITFQIDEREGKQIGQPRFQPPIYPWPSDLLTRLHKHLLNIWKFFDTYSYWLDDTIKPIINYDDQNIDKRSVIFLLQNDLHLIDEVFSDYLIEKHLSQYTISYFRNDQKIKSFQPKINSKEKLEEWICLDARKQIIDQFSFLWNYVQTEIEICIREEYTRLPDELLTPNYITKQNRKIINVIDDYPELALLNLGKIAELFLIQLIGKEYSQKGTNLAWKAKYAGLITNQQVKVFESIRREFNALKYRLDYSVDQNKIIQLWKNFSAILSREK